MTICQMLIPKRNYKLQTLFSIYEPIKHHNFYGEFDPGSG